MWMRVVQMVDIHSLAMVTMEELIKAIMMLMMTIMVVFIDDEDCVLGVVFKQRYMYYDHIMNVLSVTVHYKSGGVGSCYNETSYSYTS